MDEDDTLDHEFYKNLTESLIADLELFMTPEKREQNEKYQCYHSIKYFLKTYPNKAERKEYLQKLDEIRDAAWHGTQQGVEDTMPILFPDQGPQ